MLSWKAESQLLKLAIGHLNFFTLLVNIMRFIFIYTGVGKCRFTFVSTRNTEFILVLLLLLLFIVLFICIICLLICLITIIIKGIVIIITCMSFPIRTNLNLLWPTPVHKWFLICAVLYLYTLLCKMLAVPWYTPRKAETCSRLIMANWLFLPKHSVLCWV
jgi:hypothetical protein